MRVLLFASLLMMAACPALAQQPARTDLRVELRQVDEGGGGYSVSTQPAAPPMAPQQLQVRNGGEVQFSLEQATPIQWVQSVSAGGPTSGPSVTKGLFWLQAGQRLTVRPNWPGGKQPVAVEVEVQTSGIVETPGAELPSQSRSRLSTSVQVPLNQWVTIARTGSAPERGSYRSDSASRMPRLLQLRVTLP